MSFGYYECNVPGVRSQSYGGVLSPPPIFVKSVSVRTVYFAGARVGDMVSVQWATANSQPTNQILSCSGRVSADNYVEIYIANVSNIQSGNFGIIQIQLFKKTQA